MTLKRSFPASLALAIALSATGFAQDRAAPLDQRTVDSPTATAAPAAKANPAAPALLLASGDLLEVNLYGAPDFKSEVRIDSGGEVSLPMVSAVAVAGLSVSQAEQKIEGRLVEKRLFNDPHVTVFVKEYATQGISVLGEVQKPGIYPLLGSRRLYDAISAAGGTTPKAGTYALITHRDNPDQPVKAPIANGPTDSLANNMPIQPGDTIVVTKAGIVYVVGDVHMPGGFVMENDRNITVLQAIALAQGTNPNAALDSAKLIRKTPKGPQDIPLPLKKILASKSADIPLRNEDIVFVPNSAAKSASKRSAEMILQMATGIAVWRVP